jgi:TRAP-type transport system small permease protein
MAKFLDRVESAFNRFIRFLIAVVAASIGLYAILIPFNLLIVKTQMGSIWWLNEAIEYSLYVGVFIGAPWVLQQGAHVRVDVLVSALPTKIAVHMERFLNIVGALICLVLCVYGFRGAQLEFIFGTLPDKVLRIPNWYMLTVFSGSFFLLAVEFLFRIRRVGAIVVEEMSSHPKASF